MGIHVKGPSWHMIGAQSIGVYKETFPRKNIKEKQEKKKERKIFKEKKKKETFPCGHLYPHFSSFYTHAQLLLNIWVPYHLLWIRAERYSGFCLPTAGASTGSEGRNYQVPAHKGLDPHRHT